MHHGAAQSFLDLATPSPSPRDESTPAHVFHRGRIEIKITASKQDASSFGCAMALHASDFRQYPETHPLCLRLCLMQVAA